MDKEGNVIKFLHNILPNGVIYDVRAENGFMIYS